MIGSPPAQPCHILKALTANRNGLQFSSTEHNHMPTALACSFSPTHPLTFAGRAENCQGSYGQRNVLLLRSHRGARRKLR